MAEQKRVGLLSNVEADCARRESNGTSWLRPSLLSVMPLQRREAEIQTVYEGVHFEMVDDRHKRVMCFHTRAGFEKLLGVDCFSEDELRRLFTVHRAALERLASALYEARAADTT
jgi:hypothetical protein